MTDSPRALLRQALRCHQAGQLAEAERLYHVVLTQDPRHPDALHLLGMIEHQRGRPDTALALIERAIAACPGMAEFHNNLGTVQMALRRFEEAAAAFRQAVVLDPGLASASYNLGLALQQLNRDDEAIACYERALRLEPDAAGFNNLGVALKSRGDLPAAIRCFEQALALDPRHPDAHLNLGYGLRDLGRLDGAMDCFERRATLPDPPTSLLIQLGMLLQKHRRGRDAAAVYERVLQKERAPVVLNNLGTILMEQDRVDEAESLLREAVARQPDYAHAHSNLGNALGARRRTAEAIACYERAIQLDPEYADAHFNLAMSLLAQGDFRRGWQEYEWRWRAENFPSRLPDFPQPRWNGEDAPGKVVLLHAEQGLGDTLHFIRYLPRVAARGARVVLVCPKELHSLVRGLPGLVQLLPPTRQFPEFDYHAPLLSLPRIFGTTLENIPADVPYLPAPPLERLPLEPAAAGCLRVGVVWAGGTRYPKDHLRSLKLAQLLPLLRTPGVQFYSLQVGDKARELASLPSDVRVIDVGGRARDFADTAAAVAQLDLLISTCTSVVHLAGALACPTWVLLSYLPCWRWLFDREDSPWYPTVRLFRQQKPGDWDELLARVRVELVRQADSPQAVRAQPRRAA
jgi:tetratricopeptide (TPR) repeat protein